MFTEQWQPYANNLRAIKIDQENLRFWWFSQFFLAKSKQKLFCKTKIPWMTKIFGSNRFNKLNRFHQKTKRVNSVRKQDLCVVLKLDNISRPKTLEAWHNFAQWLVANTLCLEMIQLHKQKDGFKETWELDLYWKSRPVFQHFKYGIEIRIWSVNQDNSQSSVRFFTEWSNMWSTQF